MDVSKNSGTPKSSLSIGFSIITIHFGVPLFLGNTKILPFLKLPNAAVLKLPNSRCEWKRFPFDLISALCKALVSICWSLGFPTKLWSFQSPWLCFIHFFLSVGDLGSFSHQLNQCWSIGSLHLSYYLVLLVGSSCCGLETSLVWCARLALAWQWWFRGDKSLGERRWRRLQRWNKKNQEIRGRWVKTQLFKHQECIFEDECWLYTWFFLSILKIDVSQMKGFPQIWRNSSAFWVHNLCGHTSPSQAQYLNFVREPQTTSTL